MITLTFDKVILVNEITYGDIVIQNNPVSTATSVTLTSGTSISNNSAIVMIQIPRSELNLLKSTGGLAEETFNTFISFGNGSFQDIRRFNATEVPSTAARMASIVTSDTTDSKSGRF